MLELVLSTFPAALPPLKGAYHRMPPWQQKHMPQGHELLFHASWSKPRCWCTSSNAECSKLAQGALLCNDSAAAAEGL
jgi:hypothetical protein